MGQGPKTQIDLVRWSFNVKTDRRSEIEPYLDDLGSDDLVRDGCQFTVTRAEPGGDLEEEVEALWALNGGPFEVKLEEFRRVGSHTLEGDDPTAQEAA